MEKKKRTYTHRKGRIIPVEHGSIMDELSHDLSPEMGQYKTKRKRKRVIEL